MPKQHHSQQRDLRQNDVRIAPERSAEVTRLHVLNGTAHNLVLPLTSFIGRKREVSEIQQCLVGRTGACRLLTLTGPGGCGKTRLALEVAAELVGTFADGVWWVELASLADPALIPASVAVALGLRDTGGQPATTQLLEFLLSRTLLLVLDNCEHLVTACARLSETLLQTCPHLRILCTSREALQIAGETSWPVPALTLPDPQVLGHTAISDCAFEEISRSEAVRLFSERAAAVLPTFSLSRQNVLAVAQLCCGLDGIPLAIELAAARVKVLPVSQIARRINNSMPLLTIGSRTALPRHQTLRATIDWSHNLLCEAEQVLLRRLSVFAGSWTLEAAEAICAGAPGHDTIGAHEVLDLLTQLVHKSLVMVQEQGGLARYRLLETIRQYACENLQGLAEAKQIHYRHFAYFLALAEEGESKLQSAEQGVWFHRLEAEYDNLQAALHRVTELGEAELAVRLSGALWRFWYVRGHLDQGRTWLEAALALAGASNETCTVSASAQATALNGAGGLAYAQGDYENAQRFYAASLALRQQLQDRRGITVALNNLGLVARNLADYARATELLQQSVDQCQELEDRAGVAYALTSLGEVARCQGNYPQAAAYYEQGIVLWRELGNNEGLATALHNLGHVALYQQNYQQAGSRFRESLARFQELGSKRCIALCLAGLAGLASTTGQPERAVRLFGAAQALLEGIGAELEPADRAGYERTRAAAYVQLDETAVDAAYAEGCAMTLEQAVGDALATEENCELQPVLRATAGAENRTIQVRHGRHRQSSTDNDQRAHSADGTLRPALRIFALGPAQVLRDEQELSAADWGYFRPRELFFYLLCHPIRTKEQIGLAFWPDASSTQLRRSLGVALHHMRRALGRPDWITLDPRGYAFNCSLDYWFDAEIFESLLAEARRFQTSDPARAAICLEQAISLYRGDFLEDIAQGDWHLARQEALRRMYLDALLALGHLQVTDRHYSEAGEIYRKVIAHDNYLETAHRELMRCYARSGEHGLALRQYQSLYRLLADELGAPPAPETTALFESLRQGDDI
jgi:predicted ATPase/DNA-binding SARP family transcriptional activator